MNVVFKKSFWKQYGKLTAEQQQATDVALRCFRENPYASVLHNHALKGSMKGRRSIAAGFDLRIIFTVEGNYVTVIMLAVGRRESVYE